MYIRSLGEAGLMASSTNTMMHGVRGFFRFAHIDGLIPADPAVYARLPKVHSDESRTQGLDRLELIRFLQVAQTVTVHHGALAYLLGINALRLLPEEHARGISIELGYARLALPSGRVLSVVDVPGHERFVRTMVAGATGIDLFLMCIAADDGVMPQTREHLAVLRQLGVSRGVVAITKADLADPEVAAVEAAELLPAAEIVRVVAPRGDGLDELLSALDRAAAGAQSR